MKYRKKPVVIEAHQWDGGTNPFATYPAWMVNQWNDTLRVDHITDNLIITTLEGGMRADIGDWIIQGVKGELYPCKPDIFKETYEAVE